MIEDNFSPEAERHATVKETVGRVQVDRSRLPAKPRSLLARFRRWYRNSVLRLLVEEGSAIPQRIGWILQMREVEFLRGKDSVRTWIYQGQAPAAYGVAYIRYMQRMETLHPFLSIFEWKLMSHAWRAGLEYGIRRGKQKNQEQP